MQCSRGGKEGSRGPLPVLHLNLENDVHELRTVKIAKKSYTGKKYENGNSLINFFVGKEEKFGQIEKIFESTQLIGKTWIIVNPWKEISPEDVSKDPYGKYPDLNCRLVRCEMDVSIVVNTDRIIGHAACLKNVTGTFNIQYETFGMVGLGRLVSHLKTLFSVDLLCQLN